MITPPHIPIFQMSKGHVQSPRAGLQLAGTFSTAVCDLGSSAVPQVLQPQHGSVTGCPSTQLAARRGRSCKVCPCKGFSAQSGEVLSVLNEQIHSERDESSSTSDLGFAAA